MSTLNHSHQKYLFDPRYAQKTVVFGAGSVGGFVASFLVNMGVTDLAVWDKKSVTSHNVPMSVYGVGDVGKVKVKALREIIKAKTGVEIQINPKNFSRRTKLSNMSVVSSVDDMTARREIWNAVRKSKTVPILCDTRVAGHYVEVLVVSPNDPTDVERYEKLLYSNNSAVRQMCGLHGNVLIASRAANIAVQSIATFWQTGKKRWRVAERCDTLTRVF